MYLNYFDFLRKASDEPIFKVLHKMVSTQSSATIHPYACSPNQRADAFCVEQTPFIKRNWKKLLILVTWSKIETVSTFHCAMCSSPNWKDAYVATNAMRQTTRRSMNFILPKSYFPFLDHLIIHCRDKQDFSFTRDILHCQRDKWTTYQVFLLKKNVATLKGQNPPSWQDSKESSSSIISPTQIF